MLKQYVMDRLIALIYDLFIVAISMVIIILGLDLLNEKLFKYDNSTITKYIIIVCLIVYFVLYAIIPGIIKSTIGKTICDLKVEAINGKITFGRMLFREIVLKHIMYITIFGFVGNIVFYIIKKQTIHDFYLKTRVVKKDKEKLNSVYLKNNNI